MVSGVTSNFGLGVVNTDSFRLLAAEIMDDGTDEVRAVLLELETLDICLLSFKPPCSKSLKASEYNSGGMNTLIFSSEFHHTYSSSLRLSCWSICSSFVLLVIVPMFNGFAYIGEGKSNTFTIFVSRGSIPKPSMSSKSLSSLFWSSLSSSLSPLSFFSSN